MTQSQKTIKEVADRISDDLGLAISESRIRHYTNKFMEVTRKEGSDYRLFTEYNIQRLKDIIVLAELGVIGDSITKFFNNPNDVETIININDRLNLVKSFLPKGLKILSSL